MNNSQKKNFEILNDGFVIVNFNNIEYITAIQNEIKETFLINPMELHYQDIADSCRLNLIKKAKDSIVKKELVRNLLSANIDSFGMLFGPDIDIQSDIHLRISRPNQENDFISWHRDSFYGNSLWELNFWFPVFPLEPGAGLAVVEGSHLEKANNIQFVEEQNSFRKQVTKGSIANELGYVYAPKSDDAIAAIDQSSVRLLSPKVGQAIFFFGHMIHRAQNTSDKTRISIDVRVKNMLAPTNTKPGYYQPLTRGCGAQYVEKMQKLEQEVPCGN